jgi:hypothetical protein
VEKFESTAKLIQVIDTGSGRILTTAKHRFYVISKGWVTAEDLVVGDALATNTKLANQILRLTQWRRAMKVFNLGVDEHRNFFVGVGHILVHNMQSMGSGRQPSKF